MKTVIAIVLLMYLSLEVGGQETVEDQIDAIFGLNKTDVISENQAVAIPGGSKCKCVPYYECQNQQTIISDGHGLIDIVEQDDCPSYLEVCCKLSDKADTSNSATSIPNKGCGNRNPNGVGFRITGGKSGEAQFGEFPWMVAVLAEEYNALTDIKLNIYQCGGALIHPQVVLTAAHCVASHEKKYKIRAGEWDTLTTKELIQHQDRFVETIAIHDKYYPDALFNDIAILFLKSPLNITETVNTLCLPDQDLVVPSGTNCFANGWAKGPILQMVELSVVDRNACEEQLNKTGSGSNFQLDKSIICAGGEPEKRTCKVDSGGPLACPIPGEQDKYQHVGILARGVECDVNQVPGAYVNVPLFRHWIDEQITKKKLDTSTF